MMHVYQDAFLALRTIRTGGKQTLVVQHLVVQHFQVTDGGQAIVAGSLKSEQGKNDVRLVEKRKRARVVYKGRKVQSQPRRGGPCQSPAMKMGDTECTEAKAQ